MALRSSVVVVVREAVDVSAVEVREVTLDRSRSSRNSHASSLARTDSLRGSAVRKGWAEGSRKDLVAVGVRVLGAVVRMDQDILRKSCLVDSHHGWEARVRSPEALEQRMSLAACHGGHTVGSHRRKPRCSTTRLKGRAWMCCVRVVNANGSRADWCDVFVKTVCVQAPPLVLRLVAKSVGVVEQGVPPLCVGD